MVNDRTYACTSDFHIQPESDIQSLDAANGNRHRRPDRAYTTTEVKLKMEGYPDAQPLLYQL